MLVQDRFLKYVSFDTQSNENSTTVPSSEKQKLLGAYLAEELSRIGLEEAHMDENGYVYGWLPATKGYEDRDTIGFIAHMDTSPDAPGKDVKPSVIHYESGDINLGSSIITEKKFPVIKKYIGHDLIVTDGTTLLGADDKAGIAEIFTAVEYLVAHPEIAHGRIAVGITPDEEIGCGADHFDVAKFGAKWAYTVDGGEVPEIEYENFNGASVKLTVHGVNIHPGEAKNKMKNAALMLCDFVSRMPAAEIPAHTCGYEGFYHLTGIKGDETKAELGMIIRDHDREKFEARKVFVQKLVDYMNTVYGEGTFKLVLKDSYYNMKEQILPHMHFIDAAEAAMRKQGLSPVCVPIRGGTDGARLSYMGLPCPNLPTGGVNFHSVHEFISVQSMETMVNVLVELMKA
ncbi:MAG: peptidase T [Oscillospiraceae bacterium]|nr:peptidase T [Oscillospiraceae bacterium]